jgi:NADH:ubiquinone oxidoreductase subunit K
MNDLIWVWVGSLLLLGLSWYGLIVTRNIIKLVAVLQIMVKAVLLMVIAAGASSGQLALAQSMGITILIADTIVVVIALALAVRIFQVTGTLDVSHLASLKG